MTNPQRFSAPAPLGEHPAHDAADGIASPDAEHALNELCVAWAAWCRTRRFYGPAPLSGSLLGRLSSKNPPKLRVGGPDAPCSAELAALHLAVIAQPASALDRRVFELHYLWSVRNIKAASSELGISRQHWYRLLRDFRRRVHAASQEILQANVAALRALPHAERVSQTSDADKREETSLAT